MSEPVAVEVEEVEDSNNNSKGEFKCVECNSTFKDLGNFRNHEFVHRADYKWWTAKCHEGDTNIFLASNGWLHRLRSRSDFKSKIMYGEKGSADEPAAQAFVNTFSETLLTTR